MERLMAILKASYTTNPDGAKASIRYIPHRPNDTGTRVFRQLFGTDGAMSRDEAYTPIDQAGKRTVFFRFVISPDPQAEDTRRDLHLRLVTEETLSNLARQLDAPVGWVGAVHDDHSPHRHVHVVAVVQGRLERGDLHVMREQATHVCARQRSELDRSYSREWQREEGVWDLQY